MSPNRRTESTGFSMRTNRDRRRAGGSSPRLWADFSNVGGATQGTASGSVRLAVKRAAH